MPNLQIAVSSKLKASNQQYRLPGGGWTKGRGGENGGDPGKGCPVTGAHRSKLLAKLQVG